MVEIMVSKNGENYAVSSTMVRQTLMNMADIIYISDISDSANEDEIMLFDCKLDNFNFKFDMHSDEVFEEFGIDQEFFQVLFEDINEYISDLVEDIEDELKEVYNFSKIKMTYEVYDMNETFTDIKFVIAAAFKEIKFQDLSDFTKMAAKKQLLGSSKYFN